MECNQFQKASTTFLTVHLILIKMCTWLSNSYTSFGFVYEFVFNL